jgi:hypothetical protein
MSDPKLKYLKQILGAPVMVHDDGDSSTDPTDDSSRINDSIKHRLVDVLHIHPIPDVNQIFRGKTYCITHKTGTCKGDNI